MPYFSDNVIQLGRQQAVLYMDIERVERSHGHDRLCNFARTSITNALGIDSSQVTYDLSIGRPDEIERQYDLATEDELPQLERNSPEFKTELGLELRKRGVINTLIHGGAARAERLAWEDSVITAQLGELPAKYQRLMQVSRELYGMMPPNLDVRQFGTFAGTAQIDSSSTPPRVIVRAVCLPILLQEAAKGSLELTAQWGLPGAMNADRELDPFYRALRRAVMQSDTLASDILDNQRGPLLWSALFPERSEAPVINLTRFQELVILPARDFLQTVETKCKA